jgi:curved DNA-binding protein CbpA
MNYYEILEIKQNATCEEIRKAYKKQALQWHPDKNADPLASDKFKNIAEAYQVLSNDKKRTEYDNSLKQHKSSKRQYNNLNNHFEYEFIVKDPFEIFNEFMELFSMIPIFETLFNPTSNFIIIDHMSSSQNQHHQFQHQYHRRQSIREINGKKWITDYNNDGTQTTVLSSKDLDLLIRNTLTN